jgi:hypothetical protein
MPLPAGTVLEMGTAPTLDADAMSLYMTGLGKLNYMAQTRSDIVYAENGLARFQQRATTVHLQLLKHVAHYLIVITCDSTAPAAPPSPDAPKTSVHFLS